jgi:uncharacterized protein (DUF697 family)
MGLRDVVMSKVVLPRVKRLTPSTAGRVARAAFERAVDGVGPLQPAAEHAENQKKKAGGDSARAIKAIIADHTRLAAVEGFATNLGGLVSMAVLVPANIIGIALIQCRMVAAIAHLRGYDLTDSRVRTAVFAAMLGSKSVRELESNNLLPSRPRDIATGPPIDPATTNQISAAVTGEIMARAAGRSTVTVVGRRVPVLGGLVGGTTDAWSTRSIGRYAARELTTLR